MNSTRGANDKKHDWKENDDDGVECDRDAAISARSIRSGRSQDSWVDAIVTLLATLVFGLGWTLVELERADPPLNRYDAAASKMWVAAVATSIESRAVESVRNGRWGDEDARWTELALQSSNR